VYKDFVAFYTIVVRTLKNSGGDHICDFTP
jgi:hypothetical protein